MKTTLFAAALVAAALGSAALAWGGGPHGGDRGMPEHVQMADPSGARGMAGQPAAAGPDARGPHGRGGHGRHGDEGGIVGDVLGSVFFLGLFSD